MVNQKRGMAFIDFDNINITAKNQFGVKYLDFNGLRGVILKDLRIVGCKVYLPDKLNNLIKVIQQSGLEVTVVTPGKSIDGRLIFDLLTNTHNDNFDTAVIASGDRDYVPVIEEVKRRDKEVLVASFSSSLSHALKSVADGIIDLDSNIKNIVPKLFEYKCSKCGKTIELTFKLYPNQKPLCKKCKSTT